MFFGLNSPGSTGRSHRSETRTIDRLFPRYIRFRSAIGNRLPYQGQSHIQDQEGGQSQDQNHWELGPFQSDRKTSNGHPSTSGGSFFSKSIHVRQRIEDLERKLKRFNIWSSKSASSKAPFSLLDSDSDENQINSNTFRDVGHASLNTNNNNNSVNGCKTTPLPRRPLPFCMDACTPRKIGYEFSPCSSKDCAILPSPRKVQDDVTETERKLVAFTKQCGILKINGKDIPTGTLDLEFVRDLGHGVCGHVVKMKHRITGFEMAVKQMRRSNNLEENKQILADLEVVLKNHNSPYIVQFLGCFINEIDVWICMEFMDTSVDKVLQKSGQPLPEDIIGKIALYIVKALNYLKEKFEIIHRDVKPSNILMNKDGAIKLCDFNISGRLIDSVACTQTAGCAAYMAPERIQPSSPGKLSYDVRSDVWSLGISLMELALGRFPYGSCENHFEILTKILLTDSPTLSPNSSDFSVNFCDFLSLCLVKDYMERPKYAELLGHPFLKIYESKPVDVAGWLTFLLNS